MLVLAIISITAAFIFYTSAVWIVRFTKLISSWHLILFCIGLFFDITGTFLMSTLAQNGYTYNLHNISGVFGIVLMLFQTVWCFYVLKSKKGPVTKYFKNSGLTIWLIWLIPYLSGIVLHKA